MHKSKFYTLMQAICIRICDGTKAWLETELVLDLCRRPESLKWLRSSFLLNIWHGTMWNCWVWTNDFVNITYFDSEKHRPLRYVRKRNDLIRYDNTRMIQDILSIYTSRLKVQGWSFQPPNASPRMIVHGWTWHTLALLSVTWVSYFESVWFCNFASFCICSAALQWGLSLSLFQCNFPATFCGARGCETARWNSNAHDPPAEKYPERNRKGRAR